nr:hypothetical protein [Aggregatibacter kilianii]
MEQVKNPLIASRQVRSKFTVNFDRTFFFLYPRIKQWIKAPGSPLHPIPPLGDLAISQGFGLLTKTLQEQEAGS